MKRRSLLKAAAAAPVLTLAAPALVRAQSQTTLRFIPQSDLAFLDPHIVASWAPRNHAHMVFDSLYGLNDQYRPAAQMSAGHSVENDGKLWKITLREGLLWHDGHSVRAADCVASIKRWGVRHSFGQLLMEATDELSAPDDKTIQFRLKQPFPMLIEALSPVTGPMCAMMPERLAQTDPYKPIPEIIGSGPFRYLADQRVPGARNVYRKFDLYVPRPHGEGTGWTADPKIVHFDEVVWNTIPDSATAAAALERGEQDWWEFANPDLLPQLRSNKDIRDEVTDKSGVVTFLRPNSLQAPFNNPAVRRAVMGAIDQTMFMQSITSDAALYNTPLGFFCPGSPMASDAGMAVLTAPRDMARSKRALEQAGYKGEKVTLMVGSDIVWVKNLCDVAADVMTQLGMNVDYVSTDWGTIMSRRQKKGPVAEGGWSCFVSGQQGVDWLSPPTNNQIRASGTGAGSQAGWPDSPKLEKLRSAWLDAPDPGRQKQLAADLQRQAFQDLPYFPLGQYFQATAYRSDITGINSGFATFWNVRRTG